MANASPPRPDLAPLVAHYRDLLGLRDWTITARYAEPEEMGTALARVVPLPERKIAEMLVSTACPPEELRASIAHELVHCVVSPLANVGEWSAGALMLEEQAVEAIALAITRAEKLPAEAAVMRRALADLPSRLRARLAARPMNTRSRMDAGKALEAIKAQDGAAALELLDGYVRELINAASKDAGLSDEEAAPLEGEAAGEMMRRVLRKALARVATSAADTLGPKVLKRLKATTDAEALMTLDGMIAQASAGAGLARDADIRARKDEIGATMRAGAKRFGLDDKGELLPEYAEGTLDDVKRACARIREALPGPLTRSRVTPDTSDEAGLAERARKSGMTVEQRRASEQNVNRGRAAQGS